MSNNNSTLPILAVGALGLSSVSCVISSLTGFLVSDDSNVESNTSTSNTNTDTSNTNTDTSNTNTDTSNTNTDTSNTSTSNTYTIPHQIELGTDGWCIGTDSVHQDVPGCGRICSSAINVGSKMDGIWGPWESTTIACNGAKLDEIWEKQDDGTRKLADGYTLSTGGKQDYEEEVVGTLSYQSFGCTTFRIKSRYDYYLKDQGDGVLRSDSRILAGETKGWTIEGTYPTNFRIKGPKGYYLKDMGPDHGAGVRLDTRVIGGETNGWNLPHTGNLTNLNIKSPKGRYLCMNENGNLYFHSANIPHSNAWKIECD